jgi:WS/DGAT/MGAT family acyltransferase
MDRMSPQDAAFIHIEDDRNPMHIGNVVVFEGPPPEYGDFVRAVAGKLPLVPRYRQKVRMVPFNLGRPIWVDDPNFTILYHIRRTGLPAPGGDDELRNLAGRVLAQRLDRARPLWEIWLVEGLAGGRWAMVAKTHHAMVDGVSGTDLLTLILDRDPAGTEPIEDTWEARPQPGALGLLAATAADAVSDPLANLRALPAVASSPLRSIHYAAEIAGGALGSVSRLLRPTVGGLNGRIGPHRRWSWARGSLEDVKVVRQAFGGTVNDVVLAAIAGGFRELLRGRGEPVEGRVVRTLVPVSVRSERERGTYNNRVSAYFADLPVGEEDPVMRLDLLRDEMEDLKESHQAVAADVLTQLSGYGPAMLLALGLRVATLWPQASLNTITTNVPGPQFPLYACGRRMIEGIPYVPLWGTLRVSVAIFSYCGRLNFGVTGDYDSMADLDVLVRGIESSLADLLRRAERQRKPAAPKRRAAGTVRKPAAKPAAKPA